MDTNKHGWTRTGIGWKAVFLFLALCLNGCPTPHAFRKDYTEKTGRHTTYNVTDYNDGFQLNMTYYKFESGGTSPKTIFDARYKLKQLAEWIAEAKKHQLRPVQMEEIKSSHYYNSVTGHTYWRGTLRVYYAGK
ncbi:MAG: hypothetical protein PHH77_07115 [Victivallaceae bacterium]|nr:hypothetical protein [Victivallaceae bacterium]